MFAAELTDQLFRRSAGRLVTHLTRALGAEHLGLVEDAVQDAMLRALQTWPFNGIPDNPEAWLFRVARNRALDELRRSATLSRCSGGPKTVSPSSSSRTVSWTRSAT